MNPKALFNITYGLYLLSTKANGKDNACIINTAAQVASEPLRISISVNKGNLTHDMILESGRFNISALTTSTPFALFQRFGMQSGRSAKKFDGFEEAARAENGILYLTGCANAYLCCKVERTVDLGSHTLFIAAVDDMEVLSAVPSTTYAYYQANIKPKPESKPAAQGKTTWRCTVCGYIYEGEDLPADFICPLCKHPAADFEKVTQ